MDEKFTPQMMVEWYAKREGLSLTDFGVSSIVVLSWHPKAVQALARAVDGKAPRYWFYGERFPLYSGELKGRKVSIVHVPVGAPGTIMMMEEMIPCGAKVFIGLGYAGSLQATAPVGTFIIPTSCISEEGTSAHYLKGQSIGGPSPRLAKIIEESCLEEGVKPVKGPVWTTDAPYRETVNKISDYHNRGVIGVDMETSAMYMIGQVRRVEVCNLLIVSDELWHEWTPAFGSPQLREATEKSRQVILRTIANIS